MVRCFDLSVKWFDNMKTSLFVHRQKKVKQFSILHNFGFVCHNVRWGSQILTFVTTCFYSWPTNNTMNKSSVLLPLSSSWWHLKRRQRTIALGLYLLERTRQQILTQQWAIKTNQAEYVTAISVIFNFQETVITIDDDKWSHHCWGHVVA